MFTVTCPKGHDIEIDEPSSDEQLVGVTEDGEEIFGVMEYDEVTVKCAAPVDPDDRSKGLCGAVFVAVLRDSE